MKKTFHKLLQRQLKKQFGSLEEVPENLLPFLISVDKAYAHYDEDYALLDRSMQISDAEFLENNRILKRKNEMLDAFVYRVSHDLKSPTTNILTMLKMFGDMQASALETNPMLAKVYAHLTESANLLQVRIADLLEMSRQENVISETIEDIDIVEVLEKVRRDLSVEIETSGATIETDFAAAHFIASGRENMFSLFSNLLSNAIKYRAKDRSPVIKLKTSLEGNQTLLEISDNGIGMDLEKNGSKLFGMFNRFHDHVPGTGIGLYIVKKIIENSGGKIEVQSKLDVGTTFFIHFTNAKTNQKAELNLTH